MRGAANVPNKALTVSEVEALWKLDRVRLVMDRQCNARFLAWYADLQKNWQ